MTKLYDIHHYHHLQQQIRINHITVSVAILFGFLIATKLSHEDAVLNVVSFVTLECIFHLAR